MSNDNEEGKLFVGGLAWNTCAEKMKTYFSQWGEVNDCVLMKDKVTGNSRGFGFVKFASADSIKDVLSVKYHSIDDKQIDPKPCTPKGIQQQKKQAAIQHTQTHKVFVGGIPKDAVEKDVRQYFEKFGIVSEVVFVINKEDGRHKGFGFVTFDEEQAVNECIDKQFHEILGKKCETKRAQPREKMLTGRIPQDRLYSNNNQGNGWGNNYGYGGGMGGGSGGGGQGGGSGWGPMGGGGAGGGNMGGGYGGGGGGYGYGSGGAAGGAGGGYPTSYPGSGSYGSGGSGYGGYGTGYGYGSQAMGYAGGAAGGAGGKSDGANGGGGKGAYGGMGGAAGGYGAGGGGYGRGSGGYGGGNYAGNGGDASSGRGNGQSYHPYRR